MTSSVAVVTGGCGDVGLRAARLLARDHHVVLSDPSRERLHRALDRLDSAGVSAESIVADPADRRSMDVLMTAAREAGKIGTVVHAVPAPSADSSPAEIIRARVLGTMNVTAATLAVAGLGTTLVHADPPRAGRPLANVPRWLLRLGATDPDGLVRGLTRLADLGPARWAPVVAHTLSDTFVDWYTAHMADVFAARGARLTSADGAFTDDVPERSAPLLAGSVSRAS